ncbi:hypothetical protein JTE90_026002 [Oedothorax gibbosus]|uniref:Uncharacterized protein n=1 Tax=Oedothorax gibbosus TaxID=931172 RepID=A0AAV6UGI8_9ARAC|nr:hypothetical protein JTE90_026002 [Oedothorax gibbosus]
MGFVGQHVSYICPMQKRPYFGRIFRLRQYRTFSRLLAVCIHLILRPANSQRTVMGTYPPPPPSTSIATAVANGHFVFPPSLLYFPNSLSRELQWKRWQRFECGVK